MKVTVYLLPSRKETRTLELEEGATVERAIRALGLLPDAWIAVMHERPLAADEHLSEGDELKLFSVVSGG